MVVPPSPEGKAECWYTEYHTADLRLSLRVERFLLTKRSKYQRIDIFDSHEMGRVLALDSKIQLTERDEFMYHEMLVHPAMLSHPDPREVLLIGGGDGGAAREILKHPVERLVHVELDEEVVKACREFLPSLACSYDDPRHELVIGEGFQFLRRQPDESFDVVIVDSTDPIGPARALFSGEFYDEVRRALRPGGVAAAQGETPFLYPDVTSGLVRVFRERFSSVRVFVSFVPSYQSGMWAFVVGSDSSLDLDRGELERRMAERRIETRFYNPDVHLGLSSLPNFLRELLGS
ncbi:MAG: spermidine synthase [Thermoproteota archaeon]|nr:MAG: spermidine synthase [Candidatus Korarchaeota archaeon]